MRFKNVVPYKLKRLIPMLGLAGATMLGGCSKDDDPTQMRDVNVFFNVDEYSALKPENIKKIAAEPDVRTIYMIPQGYWGNLNSTNISNMRKNLLQPAIEASPKARGAGDFQFRIGEASKTKQDSLWYIQHGWTINKCLQNQK